VRCRRMRMNNKIWNNLALGICKAQNALAVRCRSSGSRAANVSQRISSRASASLDRRSFDGGEVDLPGKHSCVSRPYDVLRVICPIDSEAATRSTILFRKPDDSVFDVLLLVQRTWNVECVSCTYIAPVFNRYSSPESLH